MRGGFIEISVYLGCISFVLNFYASFYMLHGILSHFLTIPLISCALFGILLRYRIPRPEASLTQHYFGRDWGAYTSLKQNISTEEEFTLKVVAHRACGLDLPENTLAALKAVHREGIKVVEFDVMLTADGVPVIFHDHNLSRMSNVTRNVSEITFEEIKKIDISIKHPFGKKFPGERIPTLKEYVMYCLENDIRMIIDLKPADEMIVKVITDMFKEYPKMYKFSLVSSFNPVVIYRIRTKDPNIICSLAWRPYYYSHEEYSMINGPARPRALNLFVENFFKCVNVIHEWALWKFLYYLLGLSALLLHKDMITRDLLEYWNKRGIRVIAWNVNLPTEKQFFEKILGIAYLTDTLIKS